MRGRAGLPCAMIEIRNDEITTTIGQRKWAERLAGIFAAIADRADKRADATELDEACALTQN